MPDRTSTLRLNLRTLSMLGILLLLWAVFRLQVGEFYFSGESIAKLSRDMASWTILAAGMTLVIVSGNIDLSVGSLLALVAATCALLINGEQGFGLSATIAVPLAILVGTLLGAFQGVLTAYARIPSFIVTLGGLFIFRGITQKVSEFDPRVPDSSWVSELGFGYVPPTVGLVLACIACLVIAMMVGAARTSRLRLGLPADSLPVAGGKILLASIFVIGFVVSVNDYRGIPGQTVIMIVVLLALALLAGKTVLGRHLYAIGGNAEAARLSGVRIERRTVEAFAIMGCMTGIAGVVWMAQNQGSTKNAGTFYELYAIAAAVIGGTSLMGGRGTIFGTFLGGLVMATVIQGMDYTNLENWLQLVVRGGLLVVAVGLDMATNRRPAWIRRFRQRFIKNRSTTLPPG
jgi:D-xylose transport system permease protein